MKKPNIAGMVHCIMLFMDSCFGSVVGIVIIFCCTHIEPAVKMAMTGKGSGVPRCNQRNSCPRGMACWTMASEEYRCVARSRRASGVEGVACTMD